MALALTTVSSRGRMTKGGVKRANWACVSSDAYFLATHILA